MDPLILLDKPQGATPLEAIRMFTALNPQYRDTVLSYAGRLDPMAEGLLLILAGDQNKRRKEYETLEKTYTLMVLFGFATDTFDLLGLVTGSANPKKVTRESVLHALGHIPPLFNQTYPPYSAKRVGGKPLYYWARQGKLDTLTIPEKRVQILEKKLTDFTHITKQELQRAIAQRISRIHGNFRQKETLKGWEDLLAHTSYTSFPCATIEVSCTSGTYMRSLAHRMGELLKTPALAYRIIRTRIGSYTREHAIQLHTI